MEKLLRAIIVIAAVAMLANVAVGLLSGSSAPEVISPSDSISENQIQVYDDRVVIYMDNAFLAEYLDTNSMDPVLDTGANGLLVIPKSEGDIRVGDIVSYQPDDIADLVVHRVTSIGTDSLGTYYTLKGDNNRSSDPGKVRFDQIRYKTLGIIY